MHTLKLTLAYDGTRYAGWQRQRARPTIQAAIERALYQITRERVRVIGSGRTDAGVHALAQVAHVRVRSGLPSKSLQRALNSVLPPDIAVTQIVIMPDTFHARFQATWKRYQYHIVNDSVILPFDGPFAHLVRAPLDVARMRREARSLLGRHDFRAFHKTSRPVSDARRTIRQAQLRAQGSHLYIEVEGDGFLHTMVRRIIGTLIDVGRGFRPPGTIVRILETHDRRLLGPTAPANGLCLVKVTY